MKRRKTAVWMAAAISVALAGCSGQGTGAGQGNLETGTEMTGDKGQAGHETAGDGVNAQIDRGGTNPAKESRRAENEGEEKAKAAPMQDVTVILDYVANTNHTGMYVALDQGYYEEEGLQVRIIEPTEGATATLVAVGKGDFGISYQEDVTIALTSADPLPVKAVAAVIQHNTSGFAVYEDKDVRSPKDFEGKIYAGWGGPGEEAVLKAVMAQNQADFSKLTMVISDGSGFEALRDKADIMWFFEGWDNVKCRLHDFPIRYMPVRDLDERLDYYTPVIIAADNTLEQKPDMVRRFLSATARGYGYAMDNPRESAQILQKYAPDYSLELLTMSQEYLSQKYMEDADRWGEMEARVWDNYTEFMVEYGVIDKAVEAERCFTNEFLP